MKRKTTVYMDEDLLRELKVEAAQGGRSVSEILEEAVRTRTSPSSSRSRPVPDWAGSFESDEVTGASSEDVVRAALSDR